MDPGYLVLSRIAGSDTTSTTFSYLCWELSRKLAVAKKLQAEVDSVIKGSDLRSMPDISVIQNLPYLNAFVQEGEHYCTSALHIGQYLMIDLNLL